MAKSSKQSKVLLLIRDLNEDDFLIELWKNISTLRETYIRYLYSRRNKIKRNGRLNPTAVNRPKVSSVVPTENFSGDMVKVVDEGSNPGILAPSSIPTPPSTSIPMVKVVSGSNPGNVVPSSIPASPSPIISVVKFTPVPEPSPLNIVAVSLAVPSQPITTSSTTTTPVVAKSGPLTAPPSVKSPPPLTEELLERKTRSWSSLVAISQPPQSTCRATKNSVARKIDSPPPIVNHPNPIPAIDPDRVLSERRKRLESLGVDLTLFDEPRGGKNFYVVWKGKRVGVFGGWELTRSLVDGFPGAGYKKVASKIEAYHILEEKFCLKGS